MNWSIGLVVAVVAIVTVAWLGLKVPAPAYPATTHQLRTPATVPIPEDLPGPVRRFYQGLYGEELPVFESAVLTGRASLRVAGITFPARWRFTHDVGHGYRHEIVATWFGLPLLRVDERYVGGRGRLELPFGVEEGPAVDQGANLALWAEAVWFPAALATNPEPRWREVDEVTALLDVPFGDQTQTFIARFAADDGHLELFEAMRFKGADATEKTLWLTRATGWREVNDHPVPTVAQVQWFDERSPWATFQVETVALNVEEVEAILTGP